MTTSDPFRWEVNYEDETRAACRCGWLGPWRDLLGAVKDDETEHSCEYTEAWEERK